MSGIYHGVKKIQRRMIISEKILILRDKRSEARLD